MIQSSIVPLRLPFDGDFPVTFAFGAAAETDTLKQQYETWGIVAHNGIDYGLLEGIPVVASDDGIIIQSGENGDYGISVTVKHIWGESLYAHLQETAVVIDQKMMRGDKLGVSGKTGNATGPHLHFGIKTNDADDKNGYLGFIDPTPYFSKEAQPHTDALASSTVVEKIVEKEVIKEVIKEVLVEKIVEKIVEKEVVKEVKVVDEEEVRVLQEKALVARKQKKERSLVEILQFVDQNRKVTNGDVQSKLRVGQSTATRYLAQLTQEGKLRQEGKGRWAVYKKV